MAVNLNKEKIGNLIILLSEKVPTLYLTKLLKLLYIIDETAVSESGVPVTWLDYKAWEMGPVAIDIHSDISGSNVMFRDYFTIKNETLLFSFGPTTGKRIVAAAPFDDSEFSEYEIDLVDRIIAKFGNKSADQLISALHREDSLWHRAVEKNNLKKGFLSNKKSDVSIDLRERLDTPYKKANYDSVKEMLEL